MRFSVIVALVATFLLLPLPGGLAIPVLKAGSPIHSRYDALGVTSLAPVPDASPIPAFVVQRAWDEALRIFSERIAAPPPGFLPPERVLIVRERYALDEVHTLFGVYQQTNHLGPAGKMLVDEQIVVFLDRDCLIYEILVHEFLHALHARLSHVNARFRMLDPERLVDELYPHRDDFPECPTSKEFVE